MQSIINDKDQQLAEYESKYFQDKVHYEYFYNERIRILEQRYKIAEENLEEQSQNQTQAEQKFKIRIEELEKALKENLEAMANRETSYQAEINKNIMTVISQIQQDQESKDQLQMNLVSLDQALIKSLANEQLPAYQETDFLIKSLQQENRLLRTQISSLQSTLKSQTSNQTSIIPLKSHLESQLSILKDLITNIQDDKLQKFKDIKLLQGKILGLDEEQSKREMELMGQVDFLSNEVQQMKFIIRRDENNDYRVKYEEIRQNLDTKYQEHQMLKQGLTMCQDQVKKLESKTPLQHKTLLLELKQYSQQIQNLYSNSLISQESHYLSKIEALTQELKDIKQTHDELLIKHCRMIQMSANAHHSDTGTWKLRQQALKEEIISLQGKLESSLEKEGQTLQYKELIKSVEEATRLLESLNKSKDKEIEKAYQTQLSNLELERSQLAEQKTQLVELVQSLEERYGQISEEKEKQCGIMKEIVILNRQRMNDESLTQSTKQIQNLHQQYQSQMLNQLQSQKSFINSLTLQRNHSSGKEPKLNQEDDFMRLELLLTQQELQKAKQTIHNLDQIITKEKINLYSQILDLDKQLQRYNSSPVQEQTKISDLLEIFNSHLLKPDVASVNNLIRQLKQECSTLQKQSILDKNFVNILLKTRDERQEFMISTLKKELEDLRIQASLKISTECNHKQDRERWERLEKENVKMLKMLSSGDREGIQSLKEELQRPMSPEKQRLLHQALNGQTTLSPQTKGRPITRNVSLASTQCHTTIAAAYHGRQTPSTQSFATTRSQKKALKQ